MSWDVEKYWFYRKKGRKINLYKLHRTSSPVPDNQGRFADKGDTFIYPDENIENGLRIEYTAFNKPFVSEDPETTSESSLTEVTSPKESSHINLNRMLSLACVDYIKAMMAERSGDIQTKEYYMRAFFKKLADNQSNEKRIFVSNSQPIMSVR